MKFITQFYNEMNNRRKLYFQHSIFTFECEQEEECNFMITFTVDVRVYKFLGLQLNSLSHSMSLSSFLSSSVVATPNSNADAYVAVVFRVILS